MSALDADGLASRARGRRITAVHLIADIGFSLCQGAHPCVFAFSHVRCIPAAVGVDEI